MNSMPKPINESEIKAIIRQMREISDNHPSGEALITRAVVCGMDEHGRTHLNYNQVPPPISGVFEPLDQLLDFGSAFADTLPVGEKHFKQAQSSATAHAEIMAGDVVTLVNQICCPRCAGYLSLRGCQHVIYDARALSDDYHNRRHKHSQRTALIFERGTVGVRTLDPDAQQQTENELWQEASSPEARPLPPEETFQLLVMPEGKKPDDPALHKTLIDRAAEKLAGQKQLNAFLHYGAFASGHDHQGKPFAAIGLPTLPPGFTVEEYISDYQAGEHQPEAKYSLVVPPATALVARLRRAGIHPQTMHIGTTRPPAMRDVINVLAQPAVKGLHIAAGNETLLKALKDGKDLVEVRARRHSKSGQPYTVYSYANALQKIQQACGLIKLL